MSKQEEIIDQKATNVTALGHFEPYRTHYLKATDAEVAVERRTTEEKGQSVLRASAGWDQDKPGGSIEFPCSPS